MSAIENILGMLPDRVGDGKNSQIYTPPHIAQEMINALPEDIWNKDTTFLDICCKSGIFLYKIYQKLMESHSMQAAFPDETDRATHIVHKQLFGIAPNLFCKMFSTRTVYGYLDPDSHIISFGDNYNHVMQNPDRRFLIETLKKEFGIMKFGVVIGNPPYNKGMDLDFVDMGYKLSSNITCMITPAKWQTAEADQVVSSKNINYGQFRKLYVPHMFKVCFYPDCKDIFDIAQADGITWYILDKDEHSTVLVENKCRFVKEFNSLTERSLENGDTLNNFGKMLLNELGDYEKFKFPNVSIHKKYNIIVNTQVVLGKTDRSLLLSNDNNALVIGVCRVLDKKKGETYESSASRLIFGADTLEECEYFLSWFNSKLTKFCVLINLSKMTIMDNHVFRFVPAPVVLDNNGTKVPGKFDHIYTDEELYNAFNLPQKYRDVIESVIKERK